jgi:hypothetical protein
VMRGMPAAGFVVGVVHATATDWYREVAVTVGAAVATLGITGADVWYPEYKFGFGETVLVEKARRLKRQEKFVRPVAV